MTRAPSGLAVYASALAGALEGGRCELRLEAVEGPAPQDVRRWVADADAVDERMLDRCRGPAVDLGCGPGRLVAALARRSVDVLGVDVSPHAVLLARRRGAPVLRRDLFGPLPREGRWASALLVDGNIGIGGDPERLLARVARLVAPGGLALVEVDPRDVDRRGEVRIVAGAGQASTPFPWAVLGAPALRRAAGATGWAADEHWLDGGRAFSLLRRPG